MPTVMGWEQCGDVALMPDVAAGLLEFGAIIRAFDLPVARLLVTAAQVADEAPAAVEVHAARRAFGEHHREDVKARVRVVIQEVADGAAFVRFVRPRRERIGVGEERRHGGSEGLGAGEVVGEGGVVERGIDGTRQSIDRAGHTCEATAVSIEDAPRDGVANDKFERAIAAIDAANADDPNTIVVGGVTRPKELAHAELMTGWVRRLDPTADDAQLLAARAHHLRRWTIPRSDYPEGRAGYLRWRTTLKKQHAAEVGEMLAACGYPDDVIARVQQIVRKEGLGVDPAVQTHEDALCLVFLETQFAALAAQLGDDKTIEVVRKTLAKMSARGLDAAGEVDFTEAERDLIRRATEAL